jgi:hypothetical protein
MNDVGRSMASVHDEVWNRFTTRLDGLSDDEYFWEPAPGAWSVRPAADGRWRIEGHEEGVAAPTPPPVTTIAWRIGHIGLSFIGFGDRLFRDGATTLDDVELPGSGNAARDWLERTYRDWWRDPMDGISASRWWEPIGPAFGPYAEQNHVDLALHVLDELIHHAGEVGVLRDLYPHRTGAG